MRKDDQSVVVVRPKYYVGSSGSEWASNQIEIRHTYPHLYEMGDNLQQHSIAIRRFGACVTDYIEYVMDTYDKSDVMRVEQNKDGIHKQYEITRVRSLTRGLDTALKMLRVSDDINLLQDIVRVCVDKVQECLDYALSVQAEISKSNGRKLDKFYVHLLQLCCSVTHALQNIHLPTIKTIIGELTDAGPGVGVSNFEVTFRMVEMTRIHKTQRRTRIHRSREDSA